MKENKFNKKRRINRPYDSEFKVNALRLIEEDRSVASVAHSLAIDKSMLYSWPRHTNPVPEAEKIEMVSSTQNLIIGLAESYGLVVGL